jgi:hypothetical protein
MWSGRVWREPRTATNEALSPRFEHQPDGLFVLDDVPLVFRQRAAQQILLAALDGESGQPRVVGYTTYRDRRSFSFTGAIVAISNLPLPLDPMADAIQSRIPVLKHEPPDEELAAVMRSQARQGYEELSGPECLEVAEVVIQESASRGRRLDLRIFRNALRDRLQYERGEADNGQDLVRSLLHSVPPRPSGSRASRRS